VIKFALDISRGMKWLHSLSLIHRDMKSSNVMLNSENVCKIIDFGTTRVSQVEGMTKSVGTPFWIAPEVFLTDSYTQKADIYSFAIVMWEILTGQELYKGYKMFSIPQKVCEENLRPTIPADLKKSFPEYVEIMTSAWSKDPETRPSMEEIEISLSKLFESVQGSQQELKIISPVVKLISAPLRKSTV